MSGDAAPGVDLATVAALTLAGWLLGSIPFSLLTGRLVLRRDIRTVGDGNPGATNVSRAGGRALGAVAAFLDISKGVIPVGLAIDSFGTAGLALVPIVLAPVVGHVRSPWLRFRGGKGTATSYGVLIPLTLPVGPVAMPLLLVVAWRLLAPDGWAPVLALLAVALGLLAAGAPVERVVVTLMLAGLVASRYASDLRLGLHLRAGWTGPSSGDA